MVQPRHALLLPAFLFSGCGPRPALRPPAPVLAAAADAPTVKRIEGDLWVVGLPVHHGLERGRLLMVVTPADGARPARKVGLVRVRDGQYAAAVPVSVAYEVPGSNFHDAGAAAVGDDEIPRVEHFVAQVVERPDHRTVVLDLGADDGVEVGMRYEALAVGAETRVGAMRITAVERRRATARLLAPGPVMPGLLAVFAPESPIEREGEALVVGVCRFTPKSDGAVEVAQSFASDFTQALIAAAQGRDDVVVRQLDEAVLDPALGHEQARAIGERAGADLVVWGTLECDADERCALPRFTVVDEGRPLMAGREGERRVFRKLAADKVGAINMGIAMGVLGRLNFGADRYRAAIWHLDRALTVDGALVGDERWDAEESVALSHFYLGEWEASLDTARRIEREASDAQWRARGTLRNAVILSRRGALDRALTLYRDSLRVFDAAGQKPGRIEAIRGISQILKLKGKHGEALTLLTELLGGLEDDAQVARAQVQTEIGQLRAARGESQAAMASYRDALATFEAVGDQYGRAVMLAETGRILSRQDKNTEAIAQFERALTIFEQLGVPEQRGVVLLGMGQALLANGELDAALIRYREALGIFEALGARRESAVALAEIGRVHMSRESWGDAIRAMEESARELEAVGERRNAYLAQTHLAGALVQRDGPGDRARAATLIAAAVAAAREVGLAPDIEFTQAVNAQLGLVERVLLDIGAVIEPHIDGARIYSTAPGGAAHSALAPGDVITAVDGTSLAGLPLRDAGALIDGDRQSTVRLRIRRGGAEQTVVLSRRPAGAGQ